MIIIFIQCFIQFPYLFVPLLFCLPRSSSPPTSWLPNKFLLILKDPVLAFLPLTNHNTSLCYPLEVLLHTFTIAITATPCNYFHFFPLSPN